MITRILKICPVWVKNNPGILIISFVYLLTFLFMLPLRDQVYGDEWAYIQSVKDFVEAGKFKVSEWSTATLIFPIFYGAFFAKLFSFSPKITQLSTIAILLPGLICFYLILKRIKINETRSIIFTLVLLSFPWVFQLTYTFLTYISAMSLVIIAVFFYIRGLQDKDKLSFFLGSIISSLAFLTRQDSLVVNIALVIVLTYQKYIGQKIKSAYFLYALVLPLIVVAGYVIWVRQPGNITASQYKVSFLSTGEETLQQYFPKLLGWIMITNTYYTRDIQRIIFYFFHAIGFLLPVFLFFDIKPRLIIRFLKEHFKIVVLSWLFFLIIFGIEFVFRYSNPTYQIDPPTEITNYSKFLPVDLEKFWDKIILISVVILVPLVGISTFKFTKLFFLKTRKKFTDFFILSSLLLLLLVLIYYVKSFILIYQSKIPDSDSFFQKLNYFKDVFLSSSGKDFLYFSWLVPTTIFFVLFGILFLLTQYKLIKRNLEFKAEHFFISLVFLLYMTFMMFIMKFQWPQYIVTLIPFIIIWLAYISRFWQLNFPRTVFVLIIMLSFAISVTQVRYIQRGIEFELANKLVNMGVEPIEIQTSQSWIPWWYYDVTFKNAVDNAGGNKYKIFGLGTWQDLYDYVPIYELKQVKLDFNSKTVPLENTPTLLEVVLDSGIRYANIFSKVRYVFVKHKLSQEVLDNNLILYKRAVFNLK